MLRGLDRLKHEVARLLGGQAATISGPDGLPVAVRAGDELRVLYDGRPRRVAVLRVEPWGLRVRDLDRHGVRSFRFEKIGVGPEAAPETTAAACSQQAAAGNTMTESEAPS